MKGLLKKAAMAALCLGVLTACERDADIFRGDVDELLSRGE